MTPIIFADAGVPMLYVQMPVLILALPVVIIIEAWLSRRWLGVSWSRAGVWTTIANLVSTLAGFPIAWYAMFHMEIAATDALQGSNGGSVPWKLAEPWFSIFTTVVQAAWLNPLEDRLYWMVPTAAIVLLIPAFFVTVLIEGLIYRLAFRKTQDASAVRKATWKMHLITYGLLVAIGFGLLGWSIANHVPRNTFKSPRPDPFQSTAKQDETVDSNFKSLGPNPFQSAAKQSETVDGQQTEH